jgi:predicted amidohydrolase YtcJ
MARIDMHAAMANSAALALAGVDAGTRIDGGRLVQAEGRLTGLLVDNAMGLVERAIPAPDRAAREQALLAAQRHCFSLGLTTVADAGIDRDDVLLLDAMHRDGRLKLRVYAMLNPTEENYEHFVDRGPYLTDRLTVRAIKTFSDGALGSRGALLLEPYSDDPGNRGLQLHPREWFDAICARAARAGYQANTHAIGDAAVRLVLGVYEQHLEAGNDLRWRIEHSEIVQPEDMPRFGAKGIIPSIQTSHATSDMKWAAGRLGPRIRRAFCNRELLRQNGWLPNGSDFPVERVDPLLGFYAGVVRKDSHGFPAGGFQMENALTREETLRSMTLWAARGNFEEATRGSLEPGKWADFVILDRDLLQAPESELLSARVLATYSAGELVYQRD